MSTSAVNNPALETVQRELGSAMAATKCHRCGCYQDTVQALADSSALPGGGGRYGASLYRQRLRLLRGGRPMRTSKESRK